MSPVCLGATARRFTATVTLHLKLSRKFIIAIVIVIHFHGCLSTATLIFAKCGLTKVKVRLDRPSSHKSSDILRETAYPFSVHVLHPLNR